MMMTMMMMILCYSEKHKEVKAKKVSERTAGCCYFLFDLIVLSSDLTCSQMRDSVLSVSLLLSHNESKESGRLVIACSMVSFSL